MFDDCDYILRCPFNVALFAGCRWVTNFFIATSPAMVLEARSSISECYRLALMNGQLNCSPLLFIYPGGQRHSIAILQNSTNGLLERECQRLPSQVWLN